VILAPLLLAAAAAVTAPAGAAVTAPPGAAAAPAAHGRWLAPEVVTYAAGGTASAPVTGSVWVYLPAGYDAHPARRYPLVIALHGWNHSPALWRKRGDLGPLADRYGLVVAVPALGKTVYETQFYPESRIKWGGVPGTRWVGEVLLPHLRRTYRVAGDRAHAAIVGYSTGGRGAVLVAEAYPEFAFVGSLSGTFDLGALRPATGEYRIHAAVFGERTKRFRERWALDDVVTPARLAKLDGVTLYAGHGAADKVVEPGQLGALEKALTGRPVNAVFQRTPGAGHDWAYWNSQFPALFAALAQALGAPAP
jgi:S-formylglutathione hydrolase FrmB